MQLGEKEVQRQTETERGEGLPLTEVAIQEKEQGGLGEGWEFGRNQKETQHKAEDVSLVLENAFENENEADKFAKVRNPGETSGSVRCPHVLVIHPEDGGQPLVRKT